MATMDERVSVLEERTRSIAERVDDVFELISSGPTVPWDQSIRGKLHAMAQTLANADKLAEAAREVQRMRTSQVARWVQFVLVGAAVITAVAALIGAYAALAG